jgi:DNA-binding PadR family transcriptional regulator
MLYVHNIYPDHLDQGHPMNPGAFLPLTALDFQVLALLAEGPCHGYGIVQGAADRYPEQPALEIGSLYRIIGRMLEDGLIEEVGKPDAVRESGRKRRFYRATELGVAVLRAEAKRLRSLLAALDGLNPGAAR